MEKIREMLNELCAECERQGVPFLAACGVDRISVYEYAPDNTPERLIKARSTLVNTTRQARRQMEIEG